MQYRVEVSLLDYRKVMGYIVIFLTYQAVDGLKTSKYLIDTAIRNIEGDISIDEAQELLNSYYEENPRSDAGDRTEEADKVSVRIAKILILQRRNGY